MSPERLAQRLGHGRSRPWRERIRLDHQARAELDRFIAAFQELVGADLTLYKPAQVYSRARGRADHYRLESLDDYLLFLQRFPEERARFLNGLTPGVSEFFRDAARWSWLAEHLLPGLLGAGRALKLWSAGCASGAEAYSLAMLLEDYSPGVPHFLLATDVDREALNRAAAGVYSAQEVRCLPLHYADWFMPCEEGVAVASHIRRKVTFAAHDLLRDPFEEDFDLIACRNVMIYLSDDAKARLYERFASALALGGVLFVGSAERISEAGRFGFEEMAPGFYRRVG